jgi:ADP-ribose pyrophosphatase
MSRQSSFSFPKNMGAIRMSDSIEPLAVGRFLSLVKVGKWEYATRNNASGVVLIAPLTNENRVIFVEQFRPPVGKNVIEFPAGLAGDIEGEADEQLAAAAARELEEETGYQAKRLEHAFTGPASAGLCDEIASLYVARDLTRIGEGGGVDGENITVHEVPLAEVEAWLAERQQAGCLVDGRVYAGLYFLTRTG